MYIWINKYFIFNWFNTQIGGLAILWYQSNAILEMHGLINIQLIKSFIKWKILK